jgi:hypothetical protein
VLLGVVAVVLIRQNLRFLTGQESDDRLRDSGVRMLKEMHEIDRVAYLRLEFVGPRSVLMVAAVDLHGEEPESSVAYTLRDLEREIEKHPLVADAVLTLATPDEPSL